MFAYSNSITAKILISDSERTFIVVVMGSELFESNLLRWLAPGPMQWDDMPIAGISLLL